MGKAVGSLVAERFPGRTRKRRFVSCAGSFGHLDRPATALPVPEGPHVWRSPVYPCSAETFGRGKPLKRRNIMKSLTSKVHRFLVSEDGPTAVEYAVMLALIVIVCLTAIQAIGLRASDTFQNVADTLPAGEAAPEG